MKFKKGDKVLVEAEIDDTECCGLIVEGICNEHLKVAGREGRIHPLPPVPIEDLIELADILLCGDEKEAITAFIVPEPDTDRFIELRDKYRAAREAATKDNEMADDTLVRLRKRSPKEVEAFIQGMEYASKHRFGHEALNLAREFHEKMTKTDRKEEERICVICGEPITSPGSLSTPDGPAHIGFNDVRKEDVAEDENWLFYALEPCGHPLPIEEREKAQKPEFKEGDEVWVRGKIAGAGTLVKFSDGVLAGPNPEDIKKADD